MKRSLLRGWTNDDFHMLEKGVIRAQHQLHETGLFSDESLAQLLDNQPDDFLTISTMGSDPTRFDWIEGDRNGASGREIVELVHAGKLWLNMRQLMKFQPAIAQVVHDIYDELESKSPGFTAQDRSANLLISSSTAMVPYHVDMPVNMLWHIRGKKRVWVYPHFDHRFASQTVLEKVCGGELSEDIPYDPEFDHYALVFDVEPGQLLTWPQLTPHRVQNLGGLCVSLSTEHKNARARRRINVHEANYWLRKHVGKFCNSASAEGIGAQARQALSRAIRLGRKLSAGKAKEQFVYTKSFAIDLQSPGGIRMLDVETRTPELLREAVST
ncbi:MAG: cupin-like domain-containing protein [bacterium]|nr:cupin-like domain-containing protein [bacterium]